MVSFYLLKSLLCVAAILFHMGLLLPLTSEGIFTLSSNINVRKSRGATSHSFNHRLVPGSLTTLLGDTGTPGPVLGHFRAVVGGCCGVAVCSHSFFVYGSAEESPFLCSHQFFSPLETAPVSGLCLSPSDPSVLPLTSSSAAAIPPLTSTLDAVPPKPKKPRGLELPSSPSLPPGLSLDKV